MVNIQTLTSKITKGQKDKTKEVVVVLDNSEYEIIGVSNSLDKVLVTVQKKEVIETGDSNGTEG